MILRKNRLPFIIIAILLALCLSSCGKLLVLTRGVIYANWGIDIEACGKKIYYNSATDHFGKGQQLTVIEIDSYDAIERVVEWRAGNDDTAETGAIEILNRMDEHLAISEEAVTDTDYLPDWDDTYLWFDSTVNLIDGEALRVNSHIYLFYFPSTERVYVFEQI